MLAGFEGMKKQQDKIPPQGQPRLADAVERLIELSTATNRLDEAKKWQAERDKYPDIAPSPSEKE